ncbi:MAG: alpha/beta hydrolase [Ilumatobacter sp.]|uniref:alpha/beta hydrolase n=1 Tax=Ilumatobacter sp. TaxID=1967498 RepID=UPI0032968818
MGLDRDTAELLDTLRRLDVPPLSAGTPELARADYDAAPKPPGDPVALVVDATVPGPAGDIPVRVYSPTVATPGDTEPPVVVFFHGGGWVLSHLDGHDSLARRLAVRSGAIVVSVGYRLAPEHPFPAPHDDCWAVTSWLAEHAGEFGGDGSRLAVAGDSAGGNLAAGVALRARDEGLDLSFQLLIYPAVDVDFTRASMIDNGTGYFLTTDDMRWFWDQFVPAPLRNDPYAVPMMADDLSDLAPALIQTAEFDPLRDEGEAFGARLRDAGVDVTVTRYDGVVHGFVSRWTQMARAELAHDEAGLALRSALGISTT